MKTPNEDSIGGTISLPVASITPDPKNRKEHDGDKLKSLRDSIQAEGLMEPILVRETTKGKYKIIAGERRYRAVQLLKLSSITCRIVAGETDVGAARKRLVENMQREDLTAIEEARGYRELAVDHKLTQAEIAKLAGVGQPTVANSLRLLELPGEVQQMVQEGKLSRAHGVALATWSAWPKVCKGIAEIAISQGASSKQLEGGGLPWYWELEQKGIIVGIRTSVSSWEKATAYTLTDPIKKECVCVQVGGSWYSFAPEKWALEKKRQDAIQAAAQQAAAKKSAAGKQGAKTKEQLERAKKLATNKAARLKIQTSVASATTLLRSTKESALRSAASLVFENCGARTGDVRESAQALGIRLPAKFDAYQPSSWAALRLGEALRLIAHGIVTTEAAQAARFSGKVPRQIEFLLGKGGAK